jgi:hypothetical protein
VIGFAERCFNRIQRDGAYDENSHWEGVVILRAARQPENPLSLTRNELVKVDPPRRGG